MSAVDIDAAADELLAAYRTGKTLPPLTSTHPGLPADTRAGQRSESR